MKRILSTIIFLSIIGILHAQQPSVKVSLDSVYVTIGMPTTIHLEATVKDGQEIFFPNVLSHGGVVAYDDSLQFLLELGDDKPRIDTIPEGEGIMTLKEDIQVFAFDSATLMIPPFDFIYNGDTLSTNSLALRVIVPFDSIDVDPTKFVDIKTVIEPEFVFWDYIWWIISPIVLIILAVAVYYLYKYYIRRRGEEVIVKIEKKLPPHVIAFAALDELSEKKLWQSGQDKLFQTELTNILRQYIEDRFYISALEKTTDEILDDLYELSEHQKSSLKNLKQILQLADLTKFAKYKPLPDENQLSFMNAKMFVEQTKFEEKVMNENSEENNLEN
mgnify:CR=1 FL=1